MVYNTWKVNDKFVGKTWSYHVFYTVYCGLINFIKVTKGWDMVVGWSCPLMSNLDQTPQEEDCHLEVLCEVNGNWK